MSNAVTTADHVTDLSARERPLDVTLTRDVDPPTPAHNLLVGFHFGKSDDIEHPAIVNAGLVPIGGEDLYECWWYKGDVELKTIGNVRIAECEDVAVTVLQQPDAAAERFRKSTYDAYHELLAGVQTTEHCHLVRIWNYFGDINEGEEDREKYRQFSMGRASAFEEHGVFDEAVPTGTAIGTIGASELSIIALSSKHDFRPVENPRQVSAFRYPRQYGPKSPKFSRGGCVSVAEHSLFLISGTAAIVGHESAHPHDTVLQISETLRNLDELCAAMSGLHDGPRLVLDNECVLRVYLRDSNDLEFVARKLNGMFGSVRSNVVFLHANICRRELMVEIDGVRII